MNSGPDQARPGQPPLLQLLLPTAFSTLSCRLHDTLGTQALTKTKLATQLILDALGVVCQLVNKGMDWRSNSGPYPAPEPAQRERITLMGLLRSEQGPAPRGTGFLQEEDLSP